MRRVVIAFLCIFAVGGGIAHAHEGHDGPVRIISPKSGTYEVTIPTDWYNSLRFEAAQASTDEPPEDALYIAQSETTFQAWRMGSVVGPILQVNRLPIPEGAPDDVDAMLAESVALVVRVGDAPNYTDIDGHRAITVTGFPFRDAAHTGITVVHTAEGLYRLFYAAEDRTSYDHVRGIARTFDTGAGDMMPWRILAAAMVVSIVSLGAIAYATHKNSTHTRNAPATPPEALS